MIGVVIFFLVLLILVGASIYLNKLSKKNYAAKAEKTLQHLLSRFENQDLSTSVRYELLSTILAHCGTGHYSPDMCPLRALNKKELDRIQYVLNTDEYFKDLGVQVFQAEINHLYSALIKKGLA